MTGSVLPVDDRLHMIAGRNGEAAILEAQQVFEQHLHAEIGRRETSPSCAAALASE
jgi:hypothetical protein